MNHKKNPKPKLLTALISSSFLIAIGLSAFFVVFADVVPEEPWHPVAASYLRSTFYLNLGPQIDWPLIESEYTNEITEAGYSFANAYDAFRPVEAMFDTELIAPIQQAVADQEASAFFDAATRAVSMLSRYYLAQAEAKLSKPGAALNDVQDAERIYRAFGEDFISSADPEAFKILGRAWLDLADSVGNAGILGVGATPVKPEKFAAAKEVIESYLTANYEDGGYMVDGPYQRLFAPLPKLAVATSSIADAAVATIPVWTPPGTNLNNQDPLPLLRLNFEARGFDEADIPLVAYGDMLFDSPEVFGDPARSIGMSCSTCHNRSDINQALFIPGLSRQPGSVDVDSSFFNPYFNDQQADALDIPTLRGTRFTAPYGRDGRSADLREFLRTVHVQEFGGKEPTGFMLDALIAYVREFDFLPNSNLNPDGTLTEQASESARRGEVVFNTPFESMMDGRSCASCHVPGSHFADGQQWDIGSNTNYSDPHAFENYFDTPTLLNANYTAPYFHNGSLATLEDVVNWKNGRFKLGLSEQQLNDLNEYVKTVGAADEPYEIFDADNTPFALDWAELTTFTTTLGTMLIPRQDAFHALLLIDTVEPDMRADASGLQNYDDINMVYEVADKLLEIKTAIEQKDWASARTIYEDYQALVDEYTPLLK
jgi:cytochrome c peroxidase